TNTKDFEHRQWDPTNINVRLKFNDPQSGYKRSRYAWTKTTKTPSRWSKWKTDSNYVVTQSDFGKWYLHVEAVDHVGNIRTLYKGPYKFDNPPVANFIIQPPKSSPSSAYEGETIQLINQSYDPDGDKIKGKWKI